MSDFHPIRYHIVFDLRNSFDEVNNFAIRIASNNNSCGVLTADHLAEADR